MEIEKNGEVFFEIRFYFVIKVFEYILYYDLMIFNYFKYV